MENNRHSHALKSLQRVKKDNDPECLVCHTTGFNRQGGFISGKLTPDKANVQCESCHGAGREHANYPKVQRAETASTKYLNCHTKENSPAYNFSTYFPKIMHPQLKPAVVHNQSISEIIGVYDVIDKNKPIINNKQLELVEFFNFYCNRCYILNNNRNDLYGDLAKPVKHIEYPIIFGIEQKPWAAYAYLAAKKSDKAQEFKDAVFKAKFEDKLNIDNKDSILKIAKSLNLEGIIKKAINKESADINQQYKAIIKLKEKYKLYATPTLVINDNLLVLPKHTADNTNQLIENTKEILLDMQCRQYAICD